ncbi:MAG: glutathione S-transferase N-terminal domain-containing protein [Steroidobacteraceae bacterium]
MKLYGIGPPSPRRVAVYLAEKGIDIERVAVNLRAGEQRTPEFLKKNPLGKVPVLELDDGTYLPESAAIMEYFEERFPNPQCWVRHRESGRRRAQRNALRANM